MKFIKSEIVGCGSFLPEKVLTNADLSQMVETSDEWIVTRTGISKRHIASEGEYTSDLACNAAKEAIKNSGLSTGDIDMVIMATITPDNTTPAAACMVAKKLGLRAGAPAFDISAACSGFVYALSIADSMIKNSMANNILVIGAETLSRIVDWNDRNTCVLFGDGAGAVILKKNVTEDENASGIMTSVIYSDASRYDDLHTIGGVSTTKTASTLFMNGKEVFKTAVHCLAEGTEAVLEKNGMKTADIDWLIPHQANSRIIDSTAKMLGINADKVIMNLAETGNTSAASIPIALAQNVQNGKIKKGDIIALTSMGAGFTWGAVLLKF